MSQHEPTSSDDNDFDEIAEFVKRERITASSSRIELRPDVSADEQQLWQKQDPDYPLEHYRCVIQRQSKELVLYQTVGADYPDEDDESGQSDLYSENRELLLSPEFLIESAALKANSIDQADDLQHWIDNAYCETLTPSETYHSYQQISLGLKDLLGDDLYAELVGLAVASELERDAECEDEP